MSIIHCIQWAIGIVVITYCELLCLSQVATAVCRTVVILNSVIGVGSQVFWV